MVSPIHSETETQRATTTDVRDRGFIPAESATTAPGYSTSTVAPVVYSGFWGAVIAGSLFALSVFILSWYLMLGCHVGITDGGILALGPGAAVWLWVTSCVAFYFGGMIANMMSYRADASWLRGAIVWGLTLPLALVIVAIIGRAGLFGEAALPHMGMLETTNAQTVAAGGFRFGFVWSAFITIGLGLIFALLGSVSVGRDVRRT